MNMYMWPAYITPWFDLLQHLPTWQRDNEVAFGVTLPTACQRPDGWNSISLWRKQETVFNMTRDYKAAGYTGSWCQYFETIRLGGVVDEKRAFFKYI